MKIAPITAAHVTEARRKADEHPQAGASRINVFETTVTVTESRDTASLVSIPVYAAERGNAASQARELTTYARRIVAAR